MATRQRELLNLEGLIGPANLDLGLAGVAEPEVQDQIILGAIMAVAAADLLGLGEAARGHPHASADRRAVGRDTLEPQLNPVTGVAIYILERADLGGRIAVVGRVGVAAGPRVADDQIEVAVAVEVGGHDPVRAVVLEAGGGDRKSGG